MIDEIQAGSAPFSPRRRSNEPRRPRGKLRIFFGMAPGVGKTHAMLQSAQKERLAGRDLLLVCIHDPSLAIKNTLAKGLPRLTPDQQPLNESLPDELDLDAVLAHRPDIAIIDELAHANARSSRNPKRYQDVLELLEAGIDVFTTLNIHQVSSRADAVWNITGSTEAENVPDNVLNLAELELIDLTPRDWLRRISLGEIRMTPAQAARLGLLDEGKLLALRELTVRFFAEQIGRDKNNEHAFAEFSDLKSSDQRLLAVVTPTQASEPIVRWTRRLANDFRSPWIVLYVESPEPLPEKTLSQLTSSLAFARELGAEVLTTGGDDAVAAILRVAAQRRVTQVIVGKPAEPVPRKLFKRDSFVSRLLRESGALGVHVLPAEENESPKATSLPRGKRPILAQYVTALAVIALVTFAAFFFTPVVGAHATALVFLLTVVLLALFLDRGPTLAAAAMSAILWDYFILPPVFAFRIENFEDAMLLGMYFVVALVLGHLTTRIKAQEEAERERETRATALYLLTRALNESGDLNQIAQRSMQQLESCFNAQVALLLPNQEGELKPQTGSTLEIPKSEQDIPRWVMEHHRRAGKFTEHLPSATSLHIPLTTSGGPVGVIALRPNQSLGLTIHQENLLEAFSQQIAMALDRHRLNALTEKTKLLAESERLSKTLLDSMSHEIRTPIAAIKSATGNLAELHDTDTQIRREMIGEIQEATERLNRLVGNVLEASRLESGAVKPRLNECDVSELIHVVLADLEKELSRHKVKLDIQPGLPVVRMDFVLMQQALTNLLSNAVFHTPVGTLIEIEAGLEPENIALSVTDHGPGIPHDSLPRIFDKFYRVPNSRTGGTGLGLSLVKGFVEAQGGRVSAENRPGGGVAFTIRLPKPLSSPTPVETNL